MIDDQDYDRADGHIDWGAAYLKDLFNNPMHKVEGADKISWEGVMVALYDELWHRGFEVVRREM